MQLGMVGLGRMGANMTRRLMRGGHTLVVSDLSADAVKGLAGEGAVASSTRFGNGAPKTAMLLANTNRAGRGCAARRCRRSTLASTLQRHPRS